MTGPEVLGFCSVSQIQTFQNCPKEWQFKYDHRWQRRRVFPPLDGGSAVHEGLAAAWRQHWLRVQRKQKSKVTTRKAGLDAIMRWQKRTWQRAEKLGISDEEYLEQITQTHETACCAFETAHGAIEWKKWKVVEYNDQPLIEAQLVAPLPGWKGLVGVIDLVLEDSDGQCWVLDWKCPAVIPPEQVAEFSLQKAAYQCILQHHRIPTTGSALGYVRFRQPSVPKVNKNGTISRQEVATTWEIYAKTCEENGQNPADYDDIREKLESRPWFRMRYTFRGDVELSNTWSQVIRPAADTIRRARIYNLHPTRRISQMCTYCDFAAPCMEELRGGSAHDTLSLDFVRGWERPDDSDDQQESFNGTTA